MKVKLFSKDLDKAKRRPVDRQELENEINMWLEENATIRVIDIKQDANVDAQRSIFLWLVSVWYETST